jgi:alkylation response protein AidB-like acyl-CoA dehydrogenase
MDLRYTPEYDAFRAEVREFLEAGWPLRNEEAALPLAEREALFRQRAAERGYLYRTFPKKYGGSEQPSDILRSNIILEEFSSAGAPGELSGQGASMLAPTLLEKGTEQQKQQYIPPTLRGEMTWCQGYSEPSAGSDLASVQTKAELDGDHWVVNGHKIWTSGAHEADMMFALVRTEPDAGKHAGISYLLIDMKSPGVRAATVMQMTRAEEFCEVFFDDVRVPVANIVGERGEGWAVSRATLMHERNLIGNSDRMKANFAALVKLAQTVERNGRPASEDANIRQRLAEVQGYVATQVYSGHRMLTCIARGEMPGIDAMMTKINSTNIGHMISKLALELIGDSALEAPSSVAYSPVDNGEHASWLGDYTWSLGIATAGGTANIQRNIIAERGLGLPRQRAANLGQK